MLWKWEKGVNAVGVSPFRRLLERFDPAFAIAWRTNETSDFHAVLRILCVLWLVIGVPIAMVFSNRSSAAMLAIGGAFYLLSELIQHGPLGLLRSLVPAIKRDMLHEPILWLVIGFLLFAAISLTWTANPSTHGWRLLEFMGPVATVTAFLLLIERGNLPVPPRAFALGLILGAALLLIELKFGSPMRTFFGLRNEEYRLNRSVVVLLLLCLPYFSATLSSAHRWVLLAVLALPLWAILSSESGAALFGLMIGASALLLAHLHWRIMWFLAAVCAIIAIFSAPWQGIILTDLFPSALHEHLRSTSSAIRVEIYRAFGWAVQHAPYFGSGFDAAAHLEKEPAYAAIPEKLKGFIEFGHAHNAPLQIWVEFGLFGAIIAALLSVLVLRRIDLAPHILRPAMLGAFSAAFAIAIISHGAWQAWWAGGLGIAIVLFRAQVILRRADAPSPKSMNEGT